MTLGWLIVLAIVTGFRLLGDGTEVGKFGSPVLVNKFTEGLMSDTCGREVVGGGMLFDSEFGLLMVSLYLFIKGGYF